MENKEEIEAKLAAVKDCLDFLCWKIDRAGPNIDAHINTIDIQAVRVVQAVKQLKDAVEKK